MTFGLSIKNYVSGIYLLASTTVTPVIATGVTTKLDPEFWSNQYTLDISVSEPLRKRGLSPIVSF